MLKKILLTLGLITATSTFAANSDVFVIDKNTLVLNGVVDHNTVEPLISAILKSKEKELNIFIQSPGGNVLAAARLADVMEGSGKKFTCYTNFAASAAFYIYQLCDTRKITESGIIMQHHMSTGMDSTPLNFAKTQIELMEKLEKAWNEKQAKRLGMSTEEFTKKVGDNYFMVGQDAIDHKGADKLTKLTCSVELSNTEKEVEVMTLFGPMKQKVPACPLM